jgi:hypothetical protein
VHSGNNLPGSCGCLATPPHAIAWVRDSACRSASSGGQYIDLYQFLWFAGSASRLARAFRAIADGPERSRFGRLTRCGRRHICRSLIMLFGS